MRNQDNGRDSLDYSHGAQGGVILWGTVLLFFIGAAGSFIWATVGALRFAIRLLGE